MFKVKNINTRTRWETCLKLSDAIGVVLVSLCELWTYFTPCSSVPIVTFEQLNAGWVATFISIFNFRSSCICIQVLYKIIVLKVYIDSILWFLGELFLRTLQSRCFWSWNIVWSIRYWGNQPFLQPVIDSVTGTQKEPGQSHLTPPNFSLVSYVNESVSHSI